MRVFNRILCTIILVLILAPGALAREDVYHWEIASLAPEGFGWAKHAEEVIVRETTLATQGHLQVKIHWNGVKGDDEDYLRLMQAGELEGAGLSGQGAGLACPEFSVVELPFLFRDYGEVDYVRSRMFDEFDARFAQYGLKLLYWLDQDFDQLYSSISPMATLEDFGQTRFVLWYGPLEDALICTLNAQAVSCNAPEGAAALRQGAANAVMAPAAWMVGAQLQTVMKYVSPVKIRYSPVAVVVTSQTWNDFPEAYRQMYRAEREAITEKFNVLARADNEKCLEALVARGVKRTEMSRENLDLMKKRALTIYPQMTDLAFPRGLLITLEGYLKEYRASGPPQ
ncbi:MAG: TRAP transporter substrate-binding protein DctP [Desulfatibacillum sp.]|nr:TRAP transporter substrate-binding protein DctP [Desulfatibacillum sp.]